MVPHEASNDSFTFISFSFVKLNLVVQIPLAHSMTKRPYKFLLKAVIALSLSISIKIELYNFEILPIENTRHLKNCLY